MCANEVTNQLLSSNYIDAIKKKNPAQLKQLIKDGLIIDNKDGTYSAGSPTFKISDEVKAENMDKGLKVQSADAPVETPKAPVVSLEENEVLQKQKLEQYKQEYAEIYSKDKDLLKSDISDVVYSKEAEAIKANIENLAKSSADNRIITKDRFMRECANEEETQKFQDIFKAKLQKYMKPENAEYVRNAFNEATHQAYKENRVRKGVEATQEEILFVAQREALDEAVKLEDDALGRMANKMIQDRHLNKAHNTFTEYDEKINKAAQEGDTEKVNKLKEQGAKKIEKAKKAEAKDVEENKEKLVEYMAEAKLNREIAQERVKNRVIHWDKDDSWQEDDNNKSLNGKQRKYIKDNPDTFCDVVEEGGDFIVKGKQYKFNSEKFKDYFMALSNENELDNLKDGKDEYNNADYMMSIKNSKRGVDVEKFNKMKEQLIAQHPELADPEKLDEYLKNHVRLQHQMQEGIDAKYGDRNFLGNCAKLCGIDKEKDNTNLMRFVHVLKEGGKGAVAGFAMGCLMEGFACTKLVNGKYDNILKYSQEVVCNYKQAYSQQVDINWSASKQVHWEQPWQQEWSQKWEQKWQQDFQQDWEQNFSQDWTEEYQQQWKQDWQQKWEQKYKQEWTQDYQDHWKENFSQDWTDHYTASGSNKVTDTFTSEVWDGDYQVGGQTTVHDRDVPWTHEGDVSGTYNGTASGTYNGTASGTYNGTASGTATGTAEGTYNGTASGTYNGTASGTYNGTASGTATGTATGTASGVASGDVTVEASGTERVTVEGEVEGQTKGTAEGEVRDQGTTSARHKFDLGVPVAMAISGAISGVIKGVFTMKNVKDNGCRPETAARLKVTERNANKPEIKPIEPIKIEPVKLDIKPSELPIPEKIEIPKPQTYKGTTNNKVEEWDLNKHGKYWNQMAALYETTDGKPLTFKQAMEIVHFYNNAYDKKHSVNGLPNGGKIDLTLFDESGLTDKYKRRAEVGKFEKVTHDPKKPFVQTKYNPNTGKWEATVFNGKGEVIGSGSDKNKENAKTGAVTNAGVDSRFVIWEE